MKRILYAVVLILLLSAILLPVIGSFNNSIVHMRLVPKVFRADGSPIPPTPHVTATGPSILTADGNPLPPFPHSNATSQVLIADGNPLPPFPPKASLLFA